jgi:hypothetical protein
MPIKYSCFISYRRHSAEYAREFHSSLERELRLWTTLPIYRDETRLSGGDFFNRELALALCESACMVMIYTPTYFDRDSTYCAREFKAMEILEAKRHEILGGRRNDKHGLIIPVIYRGWNYLPSPISNLRHSYKFEFSVCGKSYLKRKEYQESIEKIAEYIYLRCNELNATGNDPCGDCDIFDIPAIDEISTWLPHLLPPTPVFPGRLV